jgi:hypothetical protein
MNFKMIVVEMELIKEERRKKKSEKAKGANNKYEERSMK